MSCRFSRAKLSQMIDGRLNESDRKRLVECIEHCVHCREAFEGMKLGSGVLRAMKAASPPPDLAARAYRRALDDEAPKGCDTEASWGETFWAYAQRFSLPMGLLALAFSALLVFSRSPVEPTTASEESQSLIADILAMPSESGLSRNRP